MNSAEYRTTTVTLPQRRSKAVLPSARRYRKWKLLPIDDARFHSGIPFPINLKDPAATTLGLYDIHYDPSQVSLNGGSSDSLQTIIEEVAHTEQFLRLWDDLKQNRIANFMKHGNVTTTYTDAKNAWLDNYAYYSAKGKAQNGDFYKNDVEKWAKNRTIDIMSGLMSKANLTKAGNVCGHDLTNVN